MSCLLKTRRAFDLDVQAGAAFWGILVDLVGGIERRNNRCSARLTTLSGRRWAFNLTVLFSSVFGLALGGANSYTAFLVLTAFVGFGVGVCER